MAMGIGLISALIVSKNRPGALTRLQKLQKLLKQKPILHKVLYINPVKYIYSALIILFFMVGLLLFLSQYKQQIINKYKANQFNFNESKKTVLKQLDQDSLKFSDLIEDFSPTLKVHQIVQRLESTIYIIEILFMIPLFILLYNMQFQRIKINGKVGQFNQHQTVGNIIKERFTINGWNQIQKIQFFNQDKIIIQLCGQDRFTNKNTYYVIKRIYKQHSYTQSQKSSLNPQNEKPRAIKEQIIMRRGHIYEARKSVIFMCHILKRQVNLTIKNGPVRKKKK